METKLNQIKMIIDQPYIEIPEESINKIYDLFIFHTIYPVTNAIEALYLGIFHACNNNYDAMKEAYMLSFGLGNTHAMNKLGHYYERTGNYEDMKKCYLLTIEKGDADAMVRLGIYYYQVEKN